MQQRDFNLYWESIINTMNEGLMVIGPDGIVMTVNREFERMTGYSADEIIGKPCTVLNCDACEKSIQKSRGGWCALFNRNRDKKVRCLIMKKDGSYLPVLKNASVLKEADGEILGAVETLTDISELDRLDRKIVLLSRQIDEKDGFQGIIGKSAVIQNVFEVIQKTAQSDAPVIIYGESGTGKELVARAIHQVGQRRDGPFVSFNCAALNEALLESELFGHIKGAFSGAYRHRQGRFEAANGGDIFLDEIGDVPLSLQVKLLRVLETKQFERVGDHQPISVDVRIITATNKYLPDLIETKEFREDLFFRINVIPIHLPPLRERAEDIPLLIDANMRRLRKKTSKKVHGVAPETMELLMAYAWPGNVRELKSALEYAFVIAEEGAIQPHQLPRQVLVRETAAPAAEPLPPARGNPAEKEALIEALRKTGGNQTQAARALGINRVTVWNRMKKYNIDLKRILVA